MYARLAFALPLALAVGLAQAQVFTRYLEAGDDYRDYIPFAVDDEVMYDEQPAIDFAAVLAEDERRGRTAARAAVRVAKDYRVKDGVWSSLGEDYVWQLGFSAPAASSINLHLNDVSLPEGSELYVVSRDGRIVHGPITAAVVYDGVYATDIIEATAVKLVARVPAEGYKQFRLRVASVNQGVKKAQKPAKGGDGNSHRWQEALDCHLDVNCSEGAGWEDERDAVVQILVNGNDFCTGTLMNDECQDFRPYVLTAFHCIDGGDGSFDNNVIDAPERNLSTYSFRFKFEAGTPTCPGNSTGSQGVHVTYSGATFRAAHLPTDMALIEINGSILNQPQLAVAGWTRLNVAPTSTTIIHHPQGDAKKISRDLQAPVQRTVNGRAAWVNLLDIGLTEPGSSGSAYFDQNHRAYGQHWAVVGGFSQCNDNLERNAGRLDISWTGGGTDDTRLSNWLSTSATAPTTRNTIRVPWVAPAAGATGPTLVCAANTTFSLQNVPAGKTLTWAVNNTTLFASTSGASRSGTGAVATLRAASSQTSGLATLTFTMTQAGCNPVVVQKQVWVGRPGTPTTSPSGTTTINIGISQFHTVHLYTSPDASTTTGTWTASGAVSRVNNTNPAAAATYVGNYAGTGNWLLATANSCGTRNYAGQYRVGTVACNPCPKVQITEPVTDELTLALVDERPVGFAATPVDPDFVLPPPRLDEAENVVELVDQSGRPVLRYRFGGTSSTQDVSALPAGLYFAKVSGAFGQETAKVVILR